MLRRLSGLDHVSIFARLAATEASTKVVLTLYASLEPTFFKVTQCAHLSRFRES